MIEVENLVKRYGNHLAVDHLTFQVEPGKIYGFLGPNGAGKSTTMNMMTGYIAPTEGTVRINGFDIQKNAEEAKRCIGYLPEIPPLYQDMTVLEYLRFAAALKKIPKKEVETQLADIMEMTMTTDVSERLIKNLSKGYKQRVGLAEGLTGLMKGNATLEVHILGSEEALRKILPFIAGIAEFSIENAPEKGAVKAVIRTEAGEDIREELFYALAENKMPILSMNRVEKSLEDIFLELTEDQSSIPDTDTAEQMSENKGGNEDEGNL